MSTPSPDNIADQSSSIRVMVVAIDGPAGAGKSTVAKAVAKQLGFLLLDTGALYRGVAYAARKSGIDWDSTIALGTLATELADSQRLYLEPAGDAVRLMLDDEDISPFIRTPEIGTGASKVSQNPAVRSALLDLQRQVARRATTGVVAEGRDMGTVVFPEARTKIYLTAELDVRVSRRTAELNKSGFDANQEDVRARVVDRDRRDSTRAVAPLKQASDATLIDATEKGINMVVAEICALATT